MKELAIGEFKILQAVNFSSRIVTIFMVRIVILDLELDRTWPLDEYSLSSVRMLSEARPESRRESESTAAWSCSESRPELDGDDVSSLPGCLYAVKR